MLVLNLQNVEELIFLDNMIYPLLPELRHIFDQWLLSKRIPTLRSLRLRSLMDLLNSLTSEHISKLENYFKDSLALDKLDYNIVKNIKLSLDDFNINDLTNYNNFGNFAISRNSNQVNISFWR